MWSSAVRIRTECACGLSSRKRLTHTGPLPSRNAVSTRIVNSAKSELTTPKPMSPSTLAASPIRAGSFSACSCSFSVML